MTANLVEFGCTGCARRFQLGRAALVNQLQRRSTCQYCGAQLDVPRDVVDEALDRQRAAEAPQRQLRGTCLLCAHVTLGEGPAGDHVPVRCRGCGLPYLLLDGGGARMIPPGNAAPPPEVDHALATLQHLGEGVTAQVLRARATAGEVAVGEAAWLATRCRELRGAPSPDVDFPLPRAEAALLLRDLMARMPTAILGTDGAYVSFRRARADVVSQVSNDTELQSFLADLLTPHGNNPEDLRELFEAAGIVADQATAMLELRATLTTTLLGTHVSWARGPAGGALEPLDAAMHQALRREIHKRLGALLPYYRRVALFGRGAEGHPALMLRPPTAGARLQQLGIRPEHAIIDQYRLSATTLPLPFLG